jgi:hypothetical protein
MCEVPGYLISSFSWSSSTTCANICFSAWESANFFLYYIYSIFATGNFCISRAISSVYPRLIRSTVGQYSHYLRSLEDNIRYLRYQAVDLKTTLMLIAQAMDTGPARSRLDSIRRAKR